MKRDLIFRGKPAPDCLPPAGDSWLYGEYVTTNGNPKIFERRDGEPRSRWDYIDPETVGQFTGLTDKNGKRIFEGDIIEALLSSTMFKCTPDICVVEFSDDCAAFGIKWKRHGLSGLVEQFTPFACICNTEYTVIGNIHDNPELLTPEA